MPVKINKYLLFFVVVFAAFWQIAFLQNGMKWDFVDAFLPSRYFFSESVLNNQFPLWNPYLLYGSPIFADLVSVFNPEFWIVGNMFGYNNIVLQYIFLIYIFIAGISFSYLLKQFNSEKHISLALSVAYMFSGFVLGNAQHLAFVAGYAVLPFLLVSYISFLKNTSKENFITLTIAVYIIVFCSYPAITIISGYLMFAFLLYYFWLNRKNKNYLKKLIITHSLLIVVVILFSAVLVVAYFQAQPFLARYSGLSADLAQKHPFSFQSFLSFIFPMTTGVETDFFNTDISMRNGYFGILSLILLVFATFSKPKKKESFVFLFFGIFSLLAALGNQFFLREFLYNYFPFLNMFQYPGLFRAFAIFGFLAFVGINYRSKSISNNKKLIVIIASAFILLIFGFIFYANQQNSAFVYLNADLRFIEKLENANWFDNIIFQGIFQLILLVTFLISLFLIKEKHKLSLVILSLFVVDGIVSTQLNIRYTVINNDNPIEFSRYLKNSPKGFPTPDLNPIFVNSDKNASNQFVWMNNNVYPKRVTFDGKVAFKLNGYTFLADEHPALLDSIKKNPLFYFSGDIRNNSKISDFSTKTVFLSEPDFNKTERGNNVSESAEGITISSFKPTKIELETTTQNWQMLVFQQNYFKGWRVFVDDEKQTLHKVNFAHMGVEISPGNHKIIFEYKNNLIIVLFIFSVLIFLGLLVLRFRYFVIHNPSKRKKSVRIVIFLLAIFFVVSISKRIIYNKNKNGFSSEIAKFVHESKSENKSNLSVFLSADDKKLKEKINPDATAFLHENYNIGQLSSFLMNNHTEVFLLAWNNCSPSQNVFEIVSSFYSETLKEKNEVNTGIILARKNEDFQQYYFEEDFENTSQSHFYWEGSRIKSDSISNNHSYFFAAHDIWGTTLQFETNERFLKAKQAVFLADIKMQNHNNFLVVLSVEREKEVLLYEVQQINSFPKYVNQWHRIAFVQNIDFQLQKNDKLKVYFWNKNQAKFQVDNLKLKFNY